MHLKSEKRIQLISAKSVVQVEFKYKVEISI
jgi:hypothetical protein